jgi:hypothetical protein
MAGCSWELKWVVTNLCRTCPNSKSTRIFVSKIHLLVCVNYHLRDVTIT